MKHTRSQLAWLVSFLPVSFLLISGACWAQTSVALGRADFRDNCASCHGPGGKGNGMLVEWLRKSPPDLTPLIREGRKVVCLRTFSKIFGLAGLRIGYGYGHPEIISVLQQDFVDPSAAEPAKLCAEIACVLCARTKTAPPAVIALASTVAETEAKLEGTLDDAATYARQKPLQALGIVAGLGMVLGLLLGRR